MPIGQVNALLAVLVILGQIFIICAIFYLLLFKKYKNRVIKFILKNSLPLALLVSFLATFGSLYYSEVAGFTPCDLCWFQRIFMYPQVILLGLAWLKKEKSVIDYSLVLIFIGSLISLYHNYIYYTAQSSTFCSIVSPCTQPYVVGFSYISIPLLALSAFLIIGLLLIGQKMNK